MLWLVLIPLRVALCSNRYAAQTGTGSKSASSKGQQPPFSMHISFYAQFMALHYSAGLQINAEDAS